MAAKDIFHDVVRTALENEGWIITHDPYLLKTDLLNEPLKVDLGAEKLIAAEKATSKILVEVKSLLKESLVYEFHSVIGQMISYQINLEIQEPDRILFLAIPLFAYKKMNLQPFYEVVIQRMNIHFLVLIVLWKP